MLVLETLDVIAVESRLKAHARCTGPPRLDEPPRDVALTAAVDRGIDRQAEGVVAGGPCPQHMVVAPGVVAEDGELADLRAVRSLGGRLQAGRAHPADAVADDKFDTRPGSRGASARTERPQD